MTYQILNFLPGSRYRTRGGFEVLIKSKELIPFKKGYENGILVTIDKVAYRARFLPDFETHPDWIYDSNGLAISPSNRDLDLVELIPEEDIYRIVNV